MPFAHMKYEADEKEIYAEDGKTKHTIDRAGWSHKEGIRFHCSTCGKKNIHHYFKHSKPGQEALKKQPGLYCDLKGDAKTCQPCLAKKREIAGICGRKTKPQLAAVIKEQQKLILELREIARWHITACCDDGHNYWEQKYPLAMAYLKPADEPKKEEPKKEEPKKIKKKTKKRKLIICETQEEAKEVMAKAEGPKCVKCEQQTPDEYLRGTAKDEAWVECVCEAHPGWYCPNHSPSNDCHQGEDCPCCK